MSDGCSRTLRAKLQEHDATLTLANDMLEIECRGHVWIRLPTDLVLNAAWEAPHLTLSVLAPSQLQKGRTLQEFSREQWKNRRRDKFVATITAHTFTFQASENASVWADEVMHAAYPRMQPYRRILVLCNPSSGRGHARKVLNSVVVPTLKAAGCHVTVLQTTARAHAYKESLSMDVSQYDVLACVGGDGTIHEVVNGLAARSDAGDVMQKLPIVPVPAGSGNGLFLSLHGVEHGFASAIACLTAIKGSPHAHELMTITQAASAFGTDSRWPYTIRHRSADGTEYVQYYSFMSQAIGIMADIDIGTEKWRFIGDARFTIGYLLGVLINKPCAVHMDVVLGPHGTTSCAEMHERSVHASTNPSQGYPVLDPHTDVHAIQYGSVVDALPLDDTPLDPSQPATPSSTWRRVQAVHSSIYAGKVPYVARTLMAFPYARPDDHLLDVLIQDQRMPAWRKILATTHGESGDHIFDQGMHYFKVAALRITPQQPEKDRGRRYISVDGEQVPYTAFQAEVSPLHVLLLSLEDEDWQPPNLKSPTVHTHKDRYMTLSEATL